MKSSGGKLPLFWIVFVAVVLADLTSKYLATSYLSPIPQPVIGDLVHWQLAYNRGAAFGISVGPASRWVFSGLVIIALGLLGIMVRTTRPGDQGRLVALALVCGGAMGNLLDRIRSARGVVDFIDVGLFGYRLPNFNFADVAIITGAIFLIIRLGREEPART